MEAYGTLGRGGSATTLQGEARCIQGAPITSPKAYTASGTRQHALASSCLAGHDWTIVSTETKRMQVCWGILLQIVYTCLVCT
jgi:hypothetical protein